MLWPLLYKVIENHLKSRVHDSIIINDFRNTVIFKLAKGFDFWFEITQIIFVSHISCFSDPRHKYFDPFKWWRTWERKYPAIANFLLKYLTITPTSVSSERCFFTVGNIVTSKKSCLLSENVNMWIFFYQNRKLLEYNLLFLYFYKLLIFNFTQHVIHIGIHIIIYNTYTHSQGHIWIFFELFLNVSKMSINFIIDNCRKNHLLKY